MSFWGKKTTKSTEITTITPIPPEVLEMAKNSGKAANGIGVSTFLDFLCSVFSRIAYTEDPMPLFLISGVLEIIPPVLIDEMSQFNPQAHPGTTDDTVVFPSILDGNPHEYRLRTYTEDSKEKIGIDFTGYARDINVLIEKTAASVFYEEILQNKGTNPGVKIISVADSNYGDALIIGIQQLKNFIFLAYRGTYSSKTAQSYVQISSVRPDKVEIGASEQTVLYGIAKIDFEIIHTVTDAIIYMIHLQSQELTSKATTTSFIGNSETHKNVMIGGDPVIPTVVATGHSLGGALATLFTLQFLLDFGKLFLVGETELSEYIICVTFGAPRTIGDKTAEWLCSQIAEQKLCFHRFSNHGDPVTALPPKQFGFTHPCSSNADKTNGSRGKVARDCNANIKLTTGLNVDYDKELNCSNVGSIWGKVAAKIVDHMVYLLISYATAADIAHLFGKSAFTLKTTEVERVTAQQLAMFNTQQVAKNKSEQERLEGLRKGIVETSDRDIEGKREIINNMNKITVGGTEVSVGDTAVRLVLAQGNGGTGTYTIAFVDLVRLRTRAFLKGLKGKEDTGDTLSVFNEIEELSKKDSETEAYKPFPETPPKPGQLPEPIPKRGILLDLTSGYNAFLETALKKELGKYTYQTQPQTAGSRKKTRKQKKRKTNKTKKNRKSQKRRVSKKSKRTKKSNK
jgi:hypothetical protein